VRVAIGASRWHLIRQLLAESMVIAVAAAAIGIPLAYGAVRAIVVIGGNALPRADGLRFDPMVALFAAGVMMFAGIAVGLLPALTTADVRLMSVANERWMGQLMTGYGEGGQCHGAWRKCVGRDGRRVGGGAGTGSSRGVSGALACAPVVKTSHRPKHRPRHRNRSSRTRSTPGDRAHQPSQTPPRARPETEVTRGPRPDR
jgi:FtsX-like permease family